ncbi:DUF6789 family protein [Thermopolyspora sp. NPDC052614]|uniref:DUF6789 family protein n=1 Tax=Thermopolyspora sp. NPDC052614 TaxID=3155682 RepID=UPI00341E4476
MIARTLRGAAAGTLATGAMSALMLAGARAGLMRHQPPKRIARAFLPGHRHRPKPGERLLGTAAHFGFGAASGAVFGLLVGDRRPRILAGVVYALAIWAVGYQGWVPRLHIMPPATQDVPERQAVMVGAHLVYGAALVLALNRLTPARPYRVETGRPMPEDRAVAPAVGGRGYGG